MDIVEPKDSEISLPLMKTNRHTYTGKSPVRLDESQQQRSSASVKSLPAVRAFSNLPVQKKLEEQNGEKTESISSEQAVQMASIGGADEEAPLAASASAFSSAPSKRPGLWDRFKAGASSLGSSIVSGAKTVGNTIGSGASWLWDKTKSGGQSFVRNASLYGGIIKDGIVDAGIGAARGVSKGIDKASAFANRDENINRKNTALGSMLPTALTGAGIYSAVDAGQKGFIQQGASAGSKVSGSLGVVGGGITGILGGVELGNAIASKDLRRGLLGGADLASGGLSVASGALSIAGTTGAAIPGLGIASAGLDTVVQGGKSIYAHQQMNKLAKMQSQVQNAIKEGKGNSFGQLSAVPQGQQGYTRDMKQQYALLNIAKEAMDVRRKQRNRAGINAVGSAIETAGHSTVVGAGVTGIGAAVGMGLVAGGKGIKGIAALVRGAKQKMIDKGWVGKGKDDERTTENKEKRAQAFIDNVLENHKDPDVYDAMDALGANKEQLTLLREGQLPRADIYKLYKAR